MIKGLTENCYSVKTPCEGNSYVRFLGQGSLTRDWKMIQVYFKQLSKSSRTSIISPILDFFKNINLFLNG